MIDVFADPSICTCLHRCIPCLAPCAHASSCRRHRLNPCYTSKHPSQSQRGCKHPYTYPAAPECIVIYPSTFPACKGCAARASLVPDHVSPTMCPQKCVPNNVSPMLSPDTALGAARSKLSWDPPHPKFQPCISDTQGDPLVLGE